MYTRNDTTHTICLPIERYDSDVALLHKMCNLFAESQDHTRLGKVCYTFTVLRYNLLTSEFNKHGIELEG